MIDKINNQAPLVSIGMPVFNSERYIGLALESLLLQEYENIEIIISDNASTDATQRICREFAAQDKRIFYYRNEVNYGAGYNFKRVLDLASGEFFMWAGSHDLWTPDCISRLISVLQAEPKVALAYTETYWIDEAGNEFNVLPYHLDTRGMPRFDRIKTVVKTLHALDLFYGLYRISELKKYGFQYTGFGADHVLMMEISLFGEIAEVPSKGFMRRVSHIHYENDVQRAEITLLRSDPKYRYKKNVRVWWALGWAHVIGIWRASIPWIEKLPLIFVVTKIFYARFQIQLRYEVFHPIFPRSRKDNEIPNW